jgi:hypothetical protein
VDGAGVNGAAWVSRELGLAGSRAQNGRVGAYVVVFALGVVLLLWAVGI